jgi:hypothetical protein
VTRTSLRRAAILLAAAHLAAAAAWATPALAATTEEEAFEIGVEAYTYAYPLVMMEITRRVSTMGTDVSTGTVAMNQYKHLSTFPDAKFKHVVRPNADTLYSTLWYDVSQRPLLISLPDTGGRYYVFPLMDMWTDVFATLGSRTTGTGAMRFVLVGPYWTGGGLPDDVRVVKSPTPTGWVLGRIQTNGAADYPSVHKLQAGFRATPLGDAAAASGPAADATGGASWDLKTPPVKQVAEMEPAAFFALFAELMKTHPPHAADYAVLLRMERLGLVPGQSFDLKAAAPEIRQGLERAAPAALKRIVGSRGRLGPPRNGWSVLTTAIGVYGNDYLTRAFIAYAGLAALPPEEAIYPSTTVDHEGQRLSGANRYVLRFEKGQLPPAKAFWSLTMYGADQYFVDNPISRYAIGDRDALVHNADGSLDLYVQRESPGKDKEANWLPAAEGPFSMNLRLYLPRPEAVDGRWTPPAVTRVR